MHPIRLLLPLTLNVLVATSALAAPITLSGNYEILGANYYNGAPTVVGRNLDNGMLFSLTDTYKEYNSSTPAGIFNPIGISNGLLTGNVLTPVHTVVAATYGLDGLVSISAFEIRTIGTNGIIGGNNVFGYAAIGTLNETGQAANIQVIQRGPTDSYGGVFGASGTLSAGAMQDVNGGLNAFIADGTAQRPIDTGTTSVARGVDPTTNSGFGSRNGEAVEWAANGTLITFNNPLSGDRIQGEVTSGFGGLRIIKASDGTLFISDGSRVMTFSDYSLALGVSLGRTPTNVFFIGDATTQMASLIYDGSIIRDTRTVQDFRNAFNSSEVPEPAALLMVGSSLISLVYARMRRQKKA